MTDELLPALPFSPYLISEWAGPEMFDRKTWTAYNEDQLRAYAREAIRQHAASDTASSKAARVLCDRFADDCNVDRDDAWMIYGADYLEDARAALKAASVLPPAGEVA